jgi:hypothetical protein
MALLFCTAEVRAEPASSARVLRSFSSCRAITAPEARASCFDAAARSLEAAVESKDIIIVDRQEVRTARRSLFGFTLPRIGLFDGGDHDEAEDSARAPRRDEFKELETTIASARSVGNGRVEIRVVEGNAVWNTTDPMPFPPKPGRKVRIRKGTMGNYFIAVEGERSVRGMRVR